MIIPIKDLRQPMNSDIALVLDRDLDVDGGSGHKKKTFMLGDIRTFLATLNIDGILCDFYIEQTKGEVLRIELDKKVIFDYKGGRNKINQNQAVVKIKKAFKEIKENADKKLLNTKSSTISKRADNKMYTKSAPLVLAQIITSKSAKLLSDKKLFSKLTSTTQILLNFWFDDKNISKRNVNFHEGQKEAILNTIYLFEIEKIKNVSKLYEAYDVKKHYIKEFNEIQGKNKEKNKEEKEEDLSNEKNNFRNLLSSFKEDNSEYKRLVYKMATSSGKTWVMNALIIWQYLNSVKGHKGYIRNFLIIAPGLTVYSRLKNSFKKDGGDITNNMNLFIPPTYKEDILSFLDNVYDKKYIDNISNGSISIVNWHFFQNKTDFIQKIQKLENIMIINDEAHYLHKETIQWQQAINKLKKYFSKNDFIQLDFSATPFTTTGNSDNAIKHYFSNIIIDFKLKRALKNGIVKLIVLDELEQRNFNDDDYGAIIDDDGNIQLSEAQKTLLKVGLHRLDSINKKISKYGEKTPKMMVTIEDSKVTNRVEIYLKDKENGLGLSSSEILVIHSNKKSELGQEKYEELKTKLLNIDNEHKIKVIVSVLMLKEGFDANNICVIVPLRATKSAILLEQTIGRGLRLMFRKEKTHKERAKRFQDIVENNSVDNFEEDTLHIIEHPAFNKFYNDLTGSIIFTTPSSPLPPDESTTVESNLKSNFEKYDMFFIRKIPKEDIDISKIEIDTIEIKVLGKYSEYALKKLQEDKDRTYTIIGKEATSQHITDEEKTIIDMFKEYKDYDDVLVDIIKNFIIKNHNFQDTSIQKRIIRNELRIILEKYISFDLFGEKFNPEENGNFNIFGMNTINLKEYIGNVFANKIKEYLLNCTEAQYEKINFSIVDIFQVKINYNLKLKKTIYTKTPYPSHSGKLEKKFMLKMDKDGFVESFIKIMEYKHDFAIIKYQNKDAMISHYHPDFMVKTKDGIYLVETKANKDMKEDTVLKKKEATKNYINEINKLDKEYRGNRKWHYVILSEDNVKNIDNFNGMVRQANIKE